MGAKPTNLVLDLGCGHRKTKGAIGVDNVALKSVDLLFDLLSFPYPIQSECANEVVLSHVLEHFSISEIDNVLSEVSRILVQEGQVVISVPHALSAAFYSDPTHKTAFTFDSIYYFSSDHPFSYYKEIHKRWRVAKIWGSVNLTNDKFQQPDRFLLQLDNIASRILNYLLHFSKTMTLPDLFVKQFPFWLVNVHFRLLRT